MVVKVVVTEKDGVPGLFLVFLLTKNGKEKAVGEFTGLQAVLEGRLVEQAQDAPQFEKGFPLALQHGEGPMPPPQASPEGNGEVPAKGHPFQFVGPRAVAGKPVHAVLRRKRDKGLALRDGENLLPETKKAATFAAVLDDHMFASPVPVIITVNRGYHTLPPGRENMHERVRHSSEITNCPSDVNEWELPDRGEIFSTQEIPGRTMTKKKTARKTTKAKTLGHAEHSKAAESIGLPGKMERSIKVTFVGAGSFFAAQIGKDLMGIPGNAGGTFALVDIDEDRLARMEKLINRTREALGADQWEVVAHTDRRKVLPGSDYVINSIEVSGLECVRYDNDIPAKYGIDQCIGDTIGPGGLFKALRTGPVLLDILRDVRELAPRALFLNYTNPMAALCLAAFRSVPEVPLVGLCHSVQGTSHLMAEEADIPYAELDWECAGINHLAWLTKLEHKGEDLYPRLMAKWEKEVGNHLKGKTGARDIVRKDMALHFGAFITESSGHLSEYLPYYRKRKDLVRDYMRPQYEGESSFYANNWPTWRKNADADREKMISGEKELNLKRSWEYAAFIIEAREKRTPYRIHGNVYNSSDGGAGQLIANLPADGCVEVPVMVDANGLNPCRVGKLPPQMASICATNMAVFDRMAEAIIHKSREAAVHALLLDPLTAAVCSPREIKAMAMELFEAEKDYLPGFA